MNYECYAWKMKTVFGYLLLHFTIISNVFSLEQVLFRKMNFNCIFQRTNLATISGTSLSDCAFNCSRWYTKCNRFSWSVTDKMCTFSSNEFVSGSSFNGQDVYSITRKGCNNFGYDYDIETNTCLHLIISSGVAWVEARTRCKQDGGDLISITSKEKFDFVFNYMKCASLVLIGFKRHMQILEPFWGTLSTKIHDFSCNYRKFPNFLCEIV